MAADAIAESRSRIMQAARRRRQTTQSRSFSSIVESGGGRLSEHHTAHGGGEAALRDRECASALAPSRVALSIARPLYWESLLSHREDKPHRRDDSPPLTPALAHRRAPGGARAAAEGLGHAAQGAHEGGGEEKQAAQTAHCNRAMGDEGQCARQCPLPVVTCGLIAGLCFPQNWTRARS